MARPKKGTSRKAAKEDIAATPPPEGKITLEQLSEMVADPATPPGELSRYFRLSEGEGEAFHPAVEINPDMVHVPDTDDARSRSALILNGANWLERNGRQARFYRLLSQGNYKGPIIVEEGDSWFQYPMILWDVIDVLMEKYAILSLSAGGDTLERMVNKSEYRKALTDTRASILLLSGGGNDLVAEGNLAAHLRPFDPALGANDYLLDSFDQLIARAMTYYDSICRDVAARFPGVQIICHGYDYPVPNKGRWLGRPMAKRGITDTGLQAAIATIMTDRFNKQMGLLARRHRHVHYLDLRGVVGSSGWKDELHPENQGYRKVAERFAAQIEKLSKKTRGSRARDAKALSLHLGLNKVDQGHYGDNLVDLDFCIADATEMEALARRQGFDTTLLTDDKASRGALQAALAEAAKVLEAGDILLMTYAGHGGQVPDFNGDELGGPDQDRLDETLCLYDGQFVDDEMFRLWSDFREGVRIVAVFDSCHSGSVVRAPAAMVQRPEVKVRQMSLSGAARVYRQNEAFYRSLPGIQAAGDPSVINRELDYPLSATVLQMSACQSNQVAAETLGHGLFTQALLETFAMAPSRYGYQAFMDRVAARMPADQTPKYWALGPRNPAFEAQMVFSV